jgi:hypothetical protein
VQDRQPGFLLRVKTLRGDHQQTALGCQLAILAIDLQQVGHRNVFATRRTNLWRVLDIQSHGQGVADGLHAFAPQPGNPPQPAIVGGNKDFFERVDAERRADPLRQPRTDLRQTGQRVASGLPPAKALERLRFSVAQHVADLASQRFSHARQLPQPVVPIALKNRRQPFAAMASRMSGLVISRNTKRVRAFEVQKTRDLIQELRHFSIREIVLSQRVLRHGCT